MNKSILKKIYIFCARISQRSMRPCQNTPIDIICPDAIHNLSKLTKNNDLLRQLTKIFEKEVPPMIEQLKKSVVDGDLTRTSRIAHAIKSSSGNLGARRLYDVCDQIEKFPNPSQNNISWMVTTLEQEYQLAIKELQKKEFYG